MDLKQLLNQTTVQVKEDTDTNIIDVNKSPSDVPLTLEPDNEHTMNDEDTQGPSDNDEEEVDIRFHQLPWNKLEKGMKMNRILLFVKKETEEHDLSPLLSKGLKTLLFRACEDGLFNKSSEVKYDEETCTINSFKSLEFNELTKKYKLKNGGTKNRSVSKSRSNIDRLMKKK